ncbi:MAG: dienelactone hydrolase family protein [Pseudomonadota bacterium]
MGEMIELTASDGHTLGAYRAGPQGKPRAGLVVVQEIFGVNRHMRGVADGFVADGYAVIAPALFDRVQPGVELGYGEADIAKGRGIREKIAPDKAMLDLAAAQAPLQGAGKIGVVGYCWGGFVAWLAATRLAGFAASVCYYGGSIAAHASEVPRCPVMMHFGDQDAAIPLSDVDQVRAAHPDSLQIFIYPAGHGFNCSERASYDAESARIARRRTLDFFKRYIG